MASGAKNKVNLQQQQGLNDESFNVHVDLNLTVYNNLHKISMHYHLPHHKKVFLSCQIQLLLKSVVPGEKKCSYKAFSSLPKKF